ncbi:cytochrome-c oxidase, cbb3-type subunit III [Hyphococcus lacteus]|uniref:Cbb3-type cytochrome c oxidase subunit n=1 Tax=Hyphococcus lacteus TaxID=3143536 RepID=A0ABV3Z6X2_9PROT
MGEPERDPYTGRMTTGHEWNGINELATPVPKLVLIFLALTFISSLIIWILAPAWPSVNNYTKGILGIDQRTTLENSLEKADAITTPWRNEINSKEFTEILNNDDLMKTVRQHGARLFADNCAMCHGTDATGGYGYPSLVDDQWLWGGDPATIMETLRIGVNSGHSESRISQMMAYGRDGILTLDQRRTVGSYILSLTQGTNADDAKLKAGSEIFMQQCQSCHGSDGRGMRSVGAPNLTDDFWIYGGDPVAIDQTLREGRQGVMPFWDDRLSLADRKALTLYVLDLAETRK